jgi:hypothetical protein
MTGSSVDKKAIEAFEADGGDEQDYDHWRQVFTNVRMNLQQQSMIDAPSVQRAKQKEINDQMIAQQKAMAARQG